MRKPTPEELLRRVEAHEAQGKRGRLKVFLGYASGVGKSFRMLDEGRRRKLRGQDVVVAAVQAESDPAVGQLLAGLELIPMRGEHGSSEIDVPKLLLRRPAVCLVDGLAYRNPPGSSNSDRWQDVEDLLCGGISVITTVNLQYIREKQAEVEAIRGKVVTESVPQEFLLKADDIEVVDAPPEYCADGSLPARQLSQLREIALILAAETVDAQLVRYLDRHGIEQTYGIHERILVCITPRSNASLMIERGKRQADRFHGELLVAYVEQHNLSATDQQTLDRNLQTARDAGASIALLHGEDVVSVILDYANGNGITQIFVGHSRQTGFLQRLRRNPVERLLLESGAIDIRIFPQREQGTLT
jgi:two-component system sensor histidine kinase KdpD